MKPPKGVDLLYMSREGVHLSWLPTRKSDTGHEQEKCITVV